MRVAAEVPQLLRRALSFALGLLPLIVVPTFSEPFADPKRVLVSLLAAGLALTAPRRWRVAWDAATALAVLGFCVAVAGLATHSAVFAALPELWLALWVLFQFATRESWIDAQAYWNGSALALAALSVFVIAQVSGAPLGPLSAGAAHGKWRAFGTLGNPNRVGWCLAALLPGAAFALRRHRRAQALLAVFGLTALVLTLARGAWLAMALVAGVMAFASRSRAPAPASVSVLGRLGRPRVFLVALSAAVLAFLVAGLFLPADRRKFLYNWDSIRGRWLAWQAAWSYFRANPALGIGLGRFEVLSREAPGARGAFAVEHVHGEYLGILVETGWTGLIALLGCVALALRQVIRSGLSAHARVALILLGIVAVLSIYDFPLREPAVLIPMVWALLKLREETGSSASDREVSRVSRSGRLPRWGFSWRISR